MHNKNSHSGETPRVTLAPKQPYEAPRVTVHGRVERLTLQTGGPIGPGIPGGGSPASATVF